MGEIRCLVERDFECGLFSALIGLGLALPVFRRQGKRGGCGRKEEGGLRVN